MPDTPTEYPGSLATPVQICELASAYRRAAQLLLLTAGERGKPLTRAPFRLSAIQSIELYLNAYLLRLGHAPDVVRGLQHDMRRRAELAISAGLKLRIKTAEHLRVLHQNREYLITRYGPELTASVSQINRLTATLDEVARKVEVSFSAAKVTAQAA